MPVSAILDHGDGRSRFTESSAPKFMLLYRCESSERNVMNIAKHCFVSGHVQGVAFRHYTRQQALKLGITGWVRNLPDGRVEVWACGESGNLEQFCRWLYRGPALAQVVDVSCHSVAASQFDSFEITG